MEKSEIVFAGTLIIREGSKQIMTTGGILARVGFANLHSCLSAHDFHMVPLSAPRKTRGASDIKISKNGQRIYQQLKERTL